MNPVVMTYHQSSDRILAEPGIEPATCCSQVRSTTDWAMGRKRIFSFIPHKQFIGKRIMLTSAETKKMLVTTIFFFSNNVCIISKIYLIILAIRGCIKPSFSGANRKSYQSDSGIIWKPNYCLKPTNFTYIFRKKYFPLITSYFSFLKISFAEQVHKDLFLSLQVTIFYLKWFFFFFFGGGGLENIVRKKRKCWLPGSFSQVR